MQKQIYVDCGAKLDGEYPGDKIWSDFCDRVGWRIDGEYVSYSDLKANPSLSPSGEFPRLVVGFFSPSPLMMVELRLGWGWVMFDLFSRIQTCKL